MLENIIKENFSSEEEKEFGQLFEDIQKELVKGRHYHLVKWIHVGETTAGAIILNEGEAYAKRFTWYCCARLKSEYDEYPEISLINKIIEYFLREPSFVWMFGHIQKVIELSKFIFQEEHRWEYPTGFLFEYFSNYLSKNKLNDEIIAALLTIQFPMPRTQEERVLNERIHRLFEDSEQFRVSEKDFIARQLNDFLLSCPIEVSGQWIKLIKKCRDEGMRSSTTKKWLNETAIFIKEEIKTPEFSRIMQLLLQQGIDYLKEKHQEGYNSALSNEVYFTQHFVFKAMIWNCSIANDKALQQQLYDFALWAFKKLPKYGPLAQTTGAAALQAFALMPTQEGVPRLMSLKNKIDNKTILKSIEKYIKEAAKNGGLSADNIEEISIPNYGMEEVGVLKMAFGTLSATTIFKPNGKNETIWDNNGKNQASVPAIVKTDFAKELKQLKSTIKEVEQLLPSQRNRIENQYLAPVSWTYKDWFSLYILHPVIGILGQRLIWHFNHNGIKCEGIFNENHFENALGEPLVLDDTTTVQLWHPIGFAAEYVQQWRNYLIHKEIVQPFKQAFREVYVVTDAELNTVNYSNRFAAHILRQHQFATLAKLRAWTYTLQGNWDSHNTPFKTLKHWNISVQYYVDAIDTERSQAGIFNFVATDQVRFYRGAVQLNMHDVPAMVFTETMRDIDMFVGVCSIGNDPNWQNNPNGQHQTYWQSYSFGELTENAKVRAETLKIIVPKLKIASKCSFENNCLLVKGKIRTYKIHLGSGNILMSPNDEYLCIVASRDKREDNVFLPFDGDSILSIILSKAFLLADDDKITDSTILRQINRK
jgi:hypothetical protein